MACCKFDQEWPRRSAVYAQTGVGRCIAVASLGQRQTVELCLFLLAFCGDLGLREHERGSRKLESAALSHHQMMLLMSAAGLIAQFRFVSTVTILQQTIRCRGAGYRRRGGNRAKGQGIMPSAKELGKRWRFFPTYAEL